jgi:hypothetical protein
VKTTIDIRVVISGNRTVFTSQETTFVLMRLLIPEDGLCSRQLFIRHLIKLSVVLRSGRVISE